MNYIKKKKKKKEVIPKAVPIHIMAILLTSGFSPP